MLGAKRLPPERCLLAGLKAGKRVAKGAERQKGSAKRREKARKVARKGREKAPRILLWSRAKARKEVAKRRKGAKSKAQTVGKSEKASGTAWFP